jgi:alpha-beta hydrolase superfamily lysophospholipase
MSAEQAVATSHGEGTFQSAEGLELYYRRWLPAVECPRAVVVIVHGFGDHCGLYTNLVNYLVARGYAVYGFDQRGYGRSPGQRGYISSWSEYREDVRAFLRLIEEEEPERACFLLGNSMGGLIVLEYAEHYPEGLRGVIAMSPALGETHVSPFLVILGRALSRVWPRFSLTVTSDYSGISHDPDAVKLYENDPLFHQRGTARLSTELFGAMKRTQDHAADLSMPLLILHGGADRLASPEGSRMFFRRLTAPDKEFKEYEGFFHNLFCDTGYEQVLADLESWLSRHL